LNLISTTEFSGITRQWPRTFLFLQGVASYFFSDLGDRLQQRGHGVRRINFNGGDRLFWQPPDALDYPGDLAGWPSFLEARLISWGVTDIVLFGDCRPLHAEALLLARQLDITTHIFEEGYLRPDWLTIEHAGINGYSSLPREIAGYPDTSQSDVVAHHVPTDMIRRSIEDVAYTAAAMVMAWKYPGYRRYRQYPALVEYASGALRLANRFFTARRRKRDIQSLITSGLRYFVWPMQIEVDSQIWVHSQFTSVEEIIDKILISFANFAPCDAVLAVTEHPLETSPRNWRRYILNRAGSCGIRQRVRFLANGTPDKFLSHCQGVVVINSTIGQRALQLGLPVIALSRAVFNMEGLTFQNGLDLFWTDAKPADAAIVHRYRQGVISKCLINGGIYSKRGIALAVTNAVTRLEERVSIPHSSHDEPVVSIDRFVDRREEC
jgi:capsular polysaccharide export protein